MLSEPPICPIHGVKSIPSKPEYGGGFICTQRDPLSFNGWCVKRWDAAGLLAPDRGASMESTVRVVVVDPETHPNGANAANAAMLLQEIIQGLVELRGEIKGLKSTIYKLQEETCEQRLAIQTFAAHAAVMADELKARRMRAANDDAFWDGIERGVKSERNGFDA